jgi:hypothetical protein
MSGFVALDDQPTVTAAWLHAVARLLQNGNRAYNLVYSVSEPSSLTAVDISVAKSFNDFAKANGLHTTETVANTIFPLDTYRSQGVAELYEYYLNDILPKVSKQWGTYFQRMIRRRNDDGSMMMLDGLPFNPLARLVQKVARRVQHGGTTTHFELSLDDPAFDLATYDAHHDSAYTIGGPCLSHLSFKMDPAGALRLTAFYRSHWYVARALGNLVGLARLQAFVASQAGAAVGPLTIIASEAVLDISAKDRSAASTRTALQACRAIFDAG